METVVAGKQNDLASCGALREPEMNPEVTDTSNKMPRWAVWAAGAAALAYLIAEHRPHLLGWIPYLIILACPVMHFLMHRGHHRHGRHAPRDDSSHGH